MKKFLELFERKIFSKASQSPGTAKLEIRLAVFVETLEFDGVVAGIQVEDVADQEDNKWVLTFLYLSLV